MPCIIKFFLYLMLRPAPRSTLFPYTTLFRSPIRIQSSLTVGTNKRICLPRPSHGSLHRFAKVHLAEPFVLLLRELAVDRKSTRLNSSHGYISYAVFCLKKKRISRHQ